MKVLGLAPVVACALGTATACGNTESAPTDVDERGIDRASGGDSAGGDSAGGDSVEPETDEGGASGAPSTGNARSDAGGSGTVSPVPHSELGTEPNVYGFSWRDAYMLLPCYGTSGHDCFTVPDPDSCPGQDLPYEERGVILSETFEIGGDAGQVYEATLVINGIVSGKYYKGGKRDAGSKEEDWMRPDGNDAFHRGGAPIPSSYDSYAMIVRDHEGNVQERYYLNSFPQDSGLETHNVVRISSEKTIEVPSGGKRRIPRARPELSSHRQLCSV